MLQLLRDFLETYRTINLSELVLPTNTTSYTNLLILTTSWCYTVPHHYYMF